MSKRANLYTGRAGQLAVMGEFLLRGAIFDHHKPGIEYEHRPPAFSGLD